MPTNQTYNREQDVMRLSGASSARFTVHKNFKSLLTAWIILMLILIKVSVSDVAQAGLETQARNQEQALQAHQRNGKQP
jgi:hypothetical protein